MGQAGLERLMDTCRRLDLHLRTEPPGRVSPAAGSLVAGLPLDPLLAGTYACLNRALFAREFYLLRVGDDVNELEKMNAWWQENWQPQLALPLFIFGGEPALAYYYATVPELVSEQGRQPVVFVDTYDLDGPYALPVASDVDRFFDTCSRYLEALRAHPDYEEYGSAALAFPWGVPEILARDERLVELVRAGRFTPLMKDTDEVRQWTARLLAARGGAGPSRA